MLQDIEIEDEFI